MISQAMTVTPSQAEIQIRLKMVPMEMVERDQKSLAQLPVQDLE